MVRDLRCYHSAADVRLSEALEAMQSFACSGCARVVTRGDAVALQAEAFAGFRGKWNLSYWVFQTHLAINGWLHRVLPAYFSDPGLVPMMTIQRSPYSAIYARIQRPFFVMLVSTLAAVLALATRAARLLLAA